MEGAPMAKTKLQRVSLSPIVKKLTQLEKAARKAKVRAKEKSEKKAFLVRVNKLKRAKKSIKAICRAFYI
jgi:hypothetical protein